ncbi:hypothetical protein [Paraburkholderia aromaticivorans]|uniref:hypothetical protein n=1 Tax=Paraburkholderia aromaticivorans TaxID=2026199 RepID=UPI00142DB566|nr:hypothetical protein [Paraburkholderia aromaticivorans]
MDKWIDPLPMLAALDAAVLFAVVRWALWCERIGARTWIAPPKRRRASLWRARAC